MLRATTNMVNPSTNNGAAEMMAPRSRAEHPTPAVIPAMLDFGVVDSCLQDSPASSPFRLHSLADNHTRFLGDRPHHRQVEYRTKTSHPFQLRALPLRFPSKPDKTRSSEDTSRSITEPPKLSLPAEGRTAGPPATCSHTHPSSACGLGSCVACGISQQLRWGL